MSLEELLKYFSKLLHCNDFLNFIEFAISAWNRTRFRKFSTKRKIKYNFYNKKQNGTKSLPKKTSSLILTVLNSLAPTAMKQNLISSICFRFGYNCPYSFIFCCEIICSATPSLPHPHTSFSAPPTVERQILILILHALFKSWYARATGCLHSHVQYGVKHVLENWNRDWIQFLIHIHDWSCEEFADLRDSRE